MGGHLLDAGKRILAGPLVHMQPAQAVGILLLAGLGALQGGDALLDGGGQLGFADQRAPVTDAEF